MDSFIDAPTVAGFRLNGTFPDAIVAFQLVGEFVIPPNNTSPSCAPNAVPINSTSSPGFTWVDLVDLDLTAQSPGKLNSVKVK